MKARRVVFSEQNQTKTLAQFTKTILVGGSLIVLPVYVSLLLLAKAVQALLVTVKPITAGILAAVEFRGMLAILALAAVCFIAGSPAYTAVGVAGRVTGQTDEPSFAPALVDRRGTGSGHDCRETEGRFLYCADAARAN